MKLTVIIPTFNTQQYIIDALESIKNQKNVNQNDFNVLIVDDGSTDKTKEVIDSWMQNNNLSDIKYIYIYNQNGNWGSVLNYCKNNNQINGQYFTILDSDDRFLNNCFENVFPHLNNDYDVIVSNVYKFKNNKIKNKINIFHTKSGLIKENKRFATITIPLCKFYKTELLYQQDDLAENVFYQDQVLFYQYMLKAKNVYYIKKGLGLYFISRPGSSSVIKYNELKIKTLMENINFLAKFNNKYLNGQLVNIFYYVYKGTKKENKKFLDKYLESKDFFNHFNTKYSHYWIILNIYFKLFYYSKLMLKRL